MCELAYRHLPPTRICEAMHLLTYGQRMTSGNKLLHSLPSKLRDYLFDFIPAQDRVVLMSTCKNWKSLVEENLKSIEHLTTDNKCASHSHWPTEFCFKAESSYPTLKTLTCPQAKDPKVLAKMLRLCLNVKQLTITTEPFALREGQKSLRLTSLMTRIECLTAPYIELDCEDVHYLKKLTHLYCCYLRNGVFQLIIGQLKTLRTICTDHKDWHEIPAGLTHMQIDYAITSDKMSGLLRSPAAETLVELRLDNLDRDSFPNVADLPLNQYGKFKNLQTLQLGIAFGPFTQNNLDFISYLLNAGKVKHFSLAVRFGSDRDDSLFPQSFCESLRGLDSLTLDTRAISQKKPKVLSNLKKIASCSPCLKELYVTVRDVSFEVVRSLSHFKQLTRLHVRFACRSDFDAESAVKLVDEMFARTPTLTLIRIGKGSWTQLDLDSLTGVRNKFGLSCEWNKCDQSNSIRKITPAL